MSDLEAADAVATLVEFFCTTLDEYRPDARFVMTRTDEVTMLAFADRGGEILNTTTRLSSGPMRPHRSNPGWQPPRFQRVKIRVQGATGDQDAAVPPILWLPGGAQQRPAIEAPTPALPDPDIIDI